MKIEDLENALRSSQTGQGSYGPNYDGNKLAEALRKLIRAATTEVDVPSSESTIPRMCEFKTDDLLRRGFKKVGYVLASEDGQQIALSDSSVRWLCRPHYDREMPVYSQFHKKPEAPVVMSSSNPEIQRGDLGDPSNHMWIVRTWMPDEALQGDERSRGTDPNQVNRGEMVWLANAAVCRAQSAALAQQLERQCRQVFKGTTRVEFTEAGRTTREPVGIAKSRMKFDIRGNEFRLYGRVEVFLVEVHQPSSGEMPGRLLNAGNATFG